jgi:cytochrome c553
MMTRHTSLGITLAIGLIAAPSTAQAQATPRAEAMASQVCAACHGSKGNSTTSAFPRLAGQQKGYLVNQLKAFRDHTRADPMAQAFMWGMAAPLSDDLIDQLAQYFSSQRPDHPARPDAKLVQLGRDIFEHGVPAENVGPCWACHGAHGEGGELGPRLADQHADYLVKQLAMFKSEMRTGALAQLMHVVTGEMTFEQMRAVAAYASRPEP